MNNLDFRLLCDVDRSVAAAYQVLRPPGDQYEDFPLRVSYLIDPDGVVRKGYLVADVRGHASEILDDLAHLQAAAR
jgi:peroxiredoxin